jgi:hypothetical protein
MFDLITLLVFIIYGWRQPSRLIFIFIWIFPYMNNAIINWVPPQFSPGYMAGYALLFIGLSNLGKIRQFQRHLLLEFSLILISYFILTTIVNLIFIDNTYLQYWSQPPLIRGLRSTLNEVFFFYLPLLILALILRFEKNLNDELNLEKYIRAFVYAGIFYSALGILQFIISFATNIDLFPIVRNNGTYLQSVAFGGLAGRITSICGEPRYLSALANLWFVILLCAGKKLQFNSSFQTFGCALFGAVVLLSGSRTGLFGLILILVFMAIMQILGYANFLTSRQVSGLIVSGLAAFFITFQGGSAIQNRVDKEDSIFNETITIAGLKVPLEFQDSESLKMISQDPTQLLIGLGSGLWQYGMNPFTNKGIAALYRSGTALDSTKSNISLIHRFTSYGTFGLFLIFIFYWKLVTYWTQGLAAKDKKELIGLFIIFMMVIQSAKLSESYAHFAAFLLLYFYREKALNKSL